MSYLLFPLIILQTCCAAFQFRQNQPANSPTVIAQNSFAACNYLDYPLLITAFVQKKVNHTHLTWVVVDSAAIICHWTAGQAD